MATFSKVEPRLKIAHHSDRFPPRYDIHKYLGRKPWYTVRDIISAYTLPDDTVLDLFSGSGVVSFEALMLGRNAIAVDCSPLSELISRSLCESCNVNEYRKESHSIISKLRRLESIYDVRTAKGIGKLRYWLPNQGRGKVLTNNTIYSGPVNEKDFTNDVPGSFSWKYADERIPEINGSNVSKWGEIFSRRTQYILYNAIGFIRDVHTPEVRRCLMVAFSAALEKASTLNHFKSGGKGWMRDRPTCYYKHTDFIEFNAVDALENKIMKMGSAITETNMLLRGKHHTFSFAKKYAEDIKYKKVVNLVIMDPPYLNEVTYDKLEMLHDIWLDFAPPKQNIMSGFRKAVSRLDAALKTDGKLVLFMLNYLPESRAFFLKGIEKAGFVRVSETKSKGRKKEGFSIMVFERAVKDI